MKVPSFEMPVSDIRADLDKIRRPLRICVLRSGNPFNVGSIIRVAHSFLVSEIILVGQEAFYKRAAMGMDKFENLVYLPDDESFVAWAAERKLPLVVFEREYAKHDLWRAEMPLESVLVFGSEAEGVPEAIVKAAHECVAIPMHGINNSFPVAVAAGIAMAEWTRRYFGSA